MTGILLASGARPAGRYVLVLGEEPVESVARARDARLILLACDAADNTRRRYGTLPMPDNVSGSRFPTRKSSWGRPPADQRRHRGAEPTLGWPQPLRTGWLRRIPPRYEESARRLDRKAARAAQRRAEQLAHEKNLRRGRAQTRSACRRGPPRPCRLKRLRRPSGAPVPHKVSPFQGSPPQTGGFPLRPQPPCQKGQGFLPQEGDVSGPIEQILPSPRVGA